MAGIKAKNTKAELAVRTFLFRQGFRYRIHDTHLPGKPDVVLPKYKTVIFINGCFWKVLKGRGLLEWIENNSFIIIPK